jgi:hypothetical protein
MSRAQLCACNCGARLPFSFVLPEWQANSERCALNERTIASKHTHRES